jgi:hypothetical protein
VRAGLHTGEVEELEGDLRGLAVHIAARICAEAGAGEVLVSQTAKELVIGSNIALAPRGTRRLKGVPGAWSLFVVLDAESTPAPSSRRSRPRLGDQLSLALARHAPRVARKVIGAEQAAARRLTARGRSGTLHT